MRITRRYKDGLVPESQVGESWEFSVEPDFPSRTHEGLLLDSILREHPDWLGAHAEHGSTPLLVKLLDAATPLSLQIHPHDDDPALADDESGKPEAWIVLDADPGACLYLGFLQGVDADAVRRTVGEGGALDALMHRVPVEPGDGFVIEPGTPHAIGAGLTLLEPQRVLPGRRGLTYRYWDWNRRYDEHGQPDPEGRPRALHLERALAVTDWTGRSADLDRIRTRHGTADLRAPVVQLDLLAAGELSVTRIAGSGEVVLAPGDTLDALTVVAGELRLTSHPADPTVRRGETLALPAGLALPLTLDAAEVYRCSVA